MAGALAVPQAVLQDGEAVSRGRARRLRVRPGRQHLVDGSAEVPNACTPRLPMVGEVTRRRQGGPGRRRGSATPTTVRRQAARAQAWPASVSKARANSVGMAGWGRAGQLRWELGAGSQGGEVAGSLINSLVFFCARPSITTWVRWLRIGVLEQERNRVGARGPRSSRSGLVVPGPSASTSTKIAPLPGFDQVDVGVFRAAL